MSAAGALSAAGAPLKPIVAWMLGPNVCSSGPTPVPYRVEMAMEWWWCRLRVTRIDRGDDCDMTGGGGDDCDMTGGGGDDDDGDDECRVGDGE